MRRKRFFTTALYAVVLGVSVSACASGGGSSEAKGDTASSASSASTGSSAVPSASETASAAAGTAGAAGGGANVSALAGKVATARDQAAHQQTYKSKTVLEYNGELASVTESQVRTSDSAQRTLTTTYPAAYTAIGAPEELRRESTSESLILKDAVYSKNDLNSPLFKDAKPWSKSTLEEPLVPTPESTAADAGQNNGPLTHLDKLIDSGEIRIAGQEVVNGVQTTHYAGTISLVRLVQDTDQTDEAREQTRQLYEALGLDRTAVDLWIGPDDLPVKVVTVAPIKLAKPMVAKTTVTYSDWGKPVDLTPPPASDVEDLGVLPPIRPRPTGPATALPSTMTH
ncbi:hypothetical protein [Streptodolium elevatio]